MRSETGLKKRGRLRVLQQVQRAGIAPATARDAIDRAFADIDDQALFDAALRKRLREGDVIADEREFSRIFRFMLGQGFESERILRALRSRRSADASSTDE